MKISIAMATFNGATYITEQLNSIADQTRLPDELVITDDASEDNTISTIQAFIMQSPFPVRLYRNPVNMGFARNFNKCLSLCGGDIVFLSDQDDYWFPNKIARVADLFESDERTCVAINDAILADATLSPMGNTRFSQAKRAGQSPANWVQGACTTIRSDLLRLLLPIPTYTYTHDHWIHAVGNLLAARAVVSLPMQYFRRHETNASSSLVSQLSPVSQRKVWTRRFGGFYDTLRKHPASVRAEMNKLLALNGWYINNQENIEALCAARRLPTPRGRAYNLEQEIAIMERRLSLVGEPRIRRVVGLLSASECLGRNLYAGRREILKDLLCGGEGTKHYA